LFEFRIKKRPPFLAILPTGQLQDVYRGFDSKFNIALHWDLDPHHTLGSAFC